MTAHDTAMGLATGTTHGAVLEFIGPRFCVVTVLACR